MNGSIRYRFQWKKWKGKPVNQYLMEPLSTMTDNRCAYCDWFPMDCGTIATIDHFKPKAIYHKEAYHWPNLYLSCSKCQDKDVGDLSEAQFEKLIRPDAPEYSFERFFIYYKHLTGEIEANPAADEDDRNRAELTIRVFHLNAPGQTTARKRMLAQFSKLDEESQKEHRQDQPFRYLLATN